MKIEKGNIIDYIGVSDIVCVTTNGIVKKNGELVMGAGCALAFKKAFPTLPKILGEQVLSKGNRPVIGGKINNSYIVSFPTKEHYKDNSDINLIKNSALFLVRIADYYNAKSICIPSPGTGLGNLSKDTVYEVLSEIFDDRFTIVEL